MKLTRNIQRANRIAVERGVSRECVDSKRSRTECFEVGIGIGQPPAAEHVAQCVGCMFQAFASHGFLSNITS